MKSHFNKKRGFTLIEVLILLMAVSILLSGAFSIFFTVITLNKHAEYQSIAYKELDSKMEIIRSNSYESAGQEEYSLGSLPKGSIKVVVNNDIGGTQEADLKKVKVTISWEFKRNHSATAVTYIARGGL